MIVALSPTVEKRQRSSLILFVSFSGPFIIGKYTLPEIQEDPELQRCLSVSDNGWNGSRGNYSLSDLAGSDVITFSLVIPGISDDALRRLLYTSSHNGFSVHYQLILTDGDPNSPSTNNIESGPVKSFGDYIEGRYHPLMALSFVLIINRFTRWIFDCCTTSRINDKRASNAWERFSFGRMNFSLSLAFSQLRKTATTCQASDPCGCSRWSVRTDPPRACWFFISLVDYHGKRLREAMTFSDELFS